MKFGEIVITDNSYSFKMSVSDVSEIDLMLSSVNVKMSEACFRMSSIPVQSRSNLLPRIDILLTTLKAMVSSSSVSMSTSVSSCSDLSWDSEHDFCVYSEDDDDFDLNMNIVEQLDLPDCDEERVNDSPDCDEERVNDPPDSDEERVNDPPDGGKERVIVNPYSPKYHSSLFPAAKEVSLMFPAAIVSAMFPTTQETMTTSMSSLSTKSVTSSEYTLYSTSSESMMSSTTMTSDSNTTVEWIYVSYSEVEEDLTRKLIKFISIAAPNAKFSVAKSRRRRRRKIMKFVHKELKILFTNSLDIFIPFQPGPVPDKRPPVPIVDWSKVNNRSLGNLPTPQMFPKHGCSDDPNIYAQRSDDRGPHGIIQYGTLHEKPFPFGGEFGLMTDLGIISTNKGDQMDDPYNHIIHGHVWSRELCRWVIHARYSKDNINNNPKVKEGGRNFKKPKKKVESR